jgi:predicted polyphosphate/ATP-dependent NAD kinase
MQKIGFLINPIAGMGGRVGLKGTDGVVDEARKLGAEPIAGIRALEMLAALQSSIRPGGRISPVKWLTCRGSMGQAALEEAGFDNIDVIYDPGETPLQDDTRSAVEAMLDAGADLIVFCGGDGTARDICQITGTHTPILGIPSGVKMYSGVFGVTPAHTAGILIGFLSGELDLAEVEILDLDEARYRQGEWVVRLYHAALTPFEPTLTQAAKAMFDEQADLEVKLQIARHLCDEIKENPHRLYVLGPGSTVKFVAGELRIDKTLLGVDVVLGGRLIARDVNERRLLELLDGHDDARLVVSPIGAQGFVLGRGNLQLSPAVISKLGPQNIIVISTPAKLTRTPCLRFDTGDADLDSRLGAAGYWPVITGFHKRRMVKVAR